MPESSRFNCMCCDRVLDGDVNENPLVIAPVYDGLIFRATGNYGSTVFDPTPIGIEEILQVVICDECMKKNATRVTRLYNIRGETIADSEEFDPDV